MSYDRAPQLGHPSLGIEFPQSNLETPQGQYIEPYYKKKKKKFNHHKMNTKM